jgi:heptaprenyl diphosphate synthase
MSVRKLALMAVLTAISLVIFIAEAQIPLPVPIPGVKLGLANAVTLFALFLSRDRGTGSLSRANTGQRTCPPVPFSTANIYTILLCRILLGAVFTGRPVVLVYSLAGGMLALTAQVIVKRYVTVKQIWVCGAIGAVFHNVGQILAAIIITGTPAIIAYLPVLIVTGVFTGVLTGLIAQLTLMRLQGNLFKI